MIVKFDFDGWLAQTLYGDCPLKNAGIWLFKFRANPVYKNGFRLFS